MIFMYGEWTRLPIQTRIKLAEVFGIKKTGPTHVSDNRIQSDGYNVDMIEAAITDEAMRAYLGIGIDDVQSNDILWKLVIDKVNGIKPKAKEVLKFAGSPNDTTISKKVA